MRPVRSRFAQANAKLQPRRKCHMPLLGSGTAATALGWVRGKPHHARSHVNPEISSLLMSIVRGGDMVDEARHLAISPHVANQLITVRRRDGGEKHSRCWEIDLLYAT